MSDVDSADGTNMASFHGDVTSQHAEQMARTAVVMASFAVVILLQTAAVIRYIVCKLSSVNIFRILIANSKIKLLL